MTPNGRSVSRSRCLVWEGALPVAMSPVAAYLASRNCQPTESEPWPFDLGVSSSMPVRES